MDFPPPVGIIARVSFPSRILLITSSWEKRPDEVSEIVVEMKLLKVEISKADFILSMLLSMLSLMAFIFIDLS